MEEVFVVCRSLVILNNNTSKLVTTVATGSLNVSMTVISNASEVNGGLLAANGKEYGVDGSSVGPPFVGFRDGGGGFFSFTLGSVAISSAGVFFLGLNLPLVSLSGGGVCPRSLRTSSIVSVFELTLSSEGVPVCGGFGMGSVVGGGGGFGLSAGGGSCSDVSYKGLVVSYKKGSTVGANSSKDTCGVMGGLNRGVVAPVPSVIRLGLRRGDLGTLSKVGFGNCTSIVSGSGSFEGSFNSVLFASCNVSNPPVLRVSNATSELLSGKGSICVAISVVPSGSVGSVSGFLSKRFTMFSRETMVSSLVNVVGGGLVPVVLGSTKVASLRGPYSSLA